MKKVYLLFCFCLLYVSTNYAQEGDCVDAVVICDDGGVSANSPNSGAVNDFASGNNGCLATGETQSNWYYFEMNASTPPGSLLGFSISPSSGFTDFDFAVYGPDVECGSLGFPIRCSFDAPGPFTTGLVAGDGDFSEGAFGGNGFLEALTVNAGEGFYLIVNNYSNDGSGFTMTWTENGAPFLNCDADPNCTLAAIPPAPVDVCQEAMPFVLSGGATGAIGPVSYSWTGDGAATSYLDDPSSATPTVNLPPDFSGTITYTLTVVEGTCQDAVDVTITVNELPSVNIPSAGPFCADSDPVILIADPAGGTWGGSVDGSGQFSPGLLGPGIHNVTYDYTDGFGCMNSATVDVEVQQSPMVSIIGDLDFCSTAGFTVLDAIGSLGDGNYTFVWDTPMGPNSGSSIIASTPGSYSVTVEDGNTCAAIETAEVTILPEPDVLIFPPDPICESSGLIVVSAVPFGGTWDVSTGIIDATGTIDPSSLTPGSYTISYSFTDANGCEGMDDVNFDINAAPVAMASTGGPYCEGDLAGLFGSTSAIGTATYSWMGPGGFSSSAQNPVSVTEAGTYTLNVSVDGCPADPVTVDIAFTPAPDALAANSGPYCRDDLIELTGSTTGTGAVTYSWTGPAGFTSSLQNPTTSNTAGTFTLIVSVDGCPSLPVTTEVTVLEVPMATASNAGPYCANDAIALFGSTTSTGLSINYNWTGPNGFTSSEQNPTNATEPGVYTLNVEVDGCPSVDAMTTVAITPQPIAMASTGGPYCEGDLAELFGSTSTPGTTSYSWTGPNGFTSTEQNPGSVSEPGTYTLDVSVDGCLSDPVTVDVAFTPGPDAMAINNGPYCRDDLIELLGSTTAAGTVSYSWTGPGGFVSSLQNPTNATVAGIYTLIVVSDGCPSPPATTEIVVFEDPDAMASNNGPYCADDAIALFGSTTSTGLVINYNWTGPNGFTSTEQNPTNATEPGTYSLTVDIDGCSSDLANTTVSVTAIPIAQANNNGPFCYDSPIELTGSTSGTGLSIGYLWSGPNGYTSFVQNPTNATEPGTYTLTVDIDGCISDPTTTEVTITPPPNAFAANDGPYCPENPLINLMGSTPTFGTTVTYSWTGPNGYTSNQQNPTDATMDGNYTLLVEVDGCPAFPIDTEVSFHQPPIPVIDGGNGFCEGDVSQLDGGLGFTNYQWSGGLSGQFIDISSGGTYDLTVTDINGCTGTTSIDVVTNPLPTASIQGNTTFCEGESTLLIADAGFVNYEWSDGQFGQAIEVSFSDTYILTITDGNGCTNTTSIDITTNELPVPAISGSLTFCSGTSTTLDAGAGFSSYLWSDNSEDQELTVTSPGTYSVTVTNAGGCTGTEVVDVEISDELDPQIIGETAFCFGAETTLDVGAGFATYNWSNSTNGQSINVNEAGIYMVTVTDASGCSGTAEVEVTENMLPTVSISGNNPICNGDMIVLDAGPGFTNYTWASGSSGQTIAVTAEGTYEVTVTDNNGCTARTEVEVIENPNPIPVIDGPTDFCQGTTATLDAGSGYTNYAWSVGGSGSSLEVSMTGTYVVTVTDANGCTGIADYTIVQNVSPTVSINGNTPICEEDMVTLDAGSGYTDYFWSNGNGTQTLEVDGAGTFGVTITDANGCTGTAEVTVVENPSPTPIIDGPADFCSGTMATLDAGNGYNIYNWSGGGNAQSLEVSTAGTYTVTVTDNNGCTGIADFTIAQSPELQPNISGPTDFCEGTMIQLDAGMGYTNYSWSSGGNGQMVDVTTTGNYLVTVSDASGCTGTASYMVVANQNPQVNILGNAPICDGEMVTLDAGDNFASYQWSNSSLNQTLEVSEGGFYEVTVTDNNGCSGTGMIEVLENPNPTPQIDGPNSFCTDSPATLDAGTGYVSYAWSDGSNDQFLDITTTGTYAVTVVDNNGCTGIADFSTQAQPLPNPSIAGSTTFCSGTSTTLDAGTGYTNYVWSDDSNGQSLEVFIAGTYEVTVTDANGCTGMTTLDVMESQSLNPVISGELNYCFGESTELDAGTGFSQYQWSDGSGGQILLVTAPGSYSVTVTDASGCSGTTDVMVDENVLPSVVINGNAPICSGETVVLDAGNGFDSYTWSNSSFNQTLEVGTEGVYVVTVTNSNGCTNIGQVDVVVNPNPEPSIVGPDDFCIGSIATLDAGTGFASYTWSTGAVDQNVDVSDGGTYSVTVVDANGCEGVDQFNINQNIPISPTIDGLLSFCVGENTLLEAAAGYTNYVWSDGSNGPTLLVTETGTYELTVTDQNTCTSTATVSVVENPNPNPVIAGSATFCIGSSTVLDAGTGYDSYTWSDGSNGQTLEINTAGTYSVTVSDQNACLGMGDFTVSQSAELTPIISGDLNYCNGDNTILDAGAGFTNYVWSDGSNGQSLEVNTPGTYAVTVSDASGCSGTTAVEVTALNLPISTILGNMPICEGASLMLDAGNGFDSYVWSNGSLNQTLQVDQAGFYSVTITDANGCSNTSETEVLANPNPIPVIDGATSICTGNTTILTTGNYVDYQWSNNTNGNEITVSEAGTYGLTVTDANGCVGTTSITVTENQSLTPLIDGDLAICAGEMSVLDAGNGYATYTWSDGSNGQTLEVSNTGTYQVTVSDVNGCTGTTEASLTVNPDPEPSIAGSSTFCIGTSTILDAGTAFNDYVWSNGTITPTNEISVAGTYGLTVTDANGCTGETSFTVSESQSLEPQISGDLNYCNGDNTILDVGTGFTNYQWSTGEMGAMITVDVPGTYSVTVSDASGCSGEVEVEVVEDNLPVVNIVGNQPICEGATIMLDAGIGFGNYLWSDGSLNQTLEVNQAGFYSVTITDANGCMNTSETEVLLNPNPEPSIAGSSTFCIGTSTTLDAGTGFNDYVWSNGTITSTNEISVAGTYSLTVTDANGCTGTTSFTVTESQSLEPQISGDLNYCDGGNTVLDAGAGYTNYQWSTGAMDATITVNAPGIYSVTVSDASGCSGEVDVEVIENMAPFAEILSNVNTCNTVDGGAEVDFAQLIINGEQTGDWLDVDGSGATGSFPLISFDGVAPGAYTFSYSTNSAVLPCIDQTYFTIIIVEDCACPSVNFNSPDPLCNVNGALDLNNQILNGGAGIWSILSTPTGMNPAILSGTILDATNADIGQYVLEYTLTETPPPGCDESFLLEVTVDNALTAGVANPPLDFCSEENMLVALTDEIIGADAGGVWTEVSANPSTGLAFDPTTATFNTENQLPGTYLFQYELFANGACPGDLETVSITINELPTAEAGTGTELTCDDNEFVLNGSGSIGNDFTINWTGPGLILNDNTLTPTINAPGMFTLTIINDLTGCESMDQVEITQNANVPIALAQGNEITCDSTSVTLLGASASGATDLTWQWSGPGIDNGNMNLQNPTVNIPGAYSLVVIDDENNCISSPVEVTVDDNTNLPSVIVDLPLSALDCNTANVELDATSSVGGGVLTYQWLDANGDVLSTDPVLMVDNPGDYTLVVNDQQNGCSATDEIEVIDNTNFPIADAGNPQALNCAITEVQLSGAASSVGSEIVYTWLDPTGVVVQGPSNDPMVNVGNAGNYTLIVEDESNGCTTPAMVLVSQDIQAPTAQIATPDQLDCTVTEVELNAAGSSSGAQYTYQWLDAAGNPLSSNVLLTVSNAGTYQFMVTNTENQCNDINSVDVSTNTNVPSAAVLDVNAPSCFEENDGAIQIMDVVGGTVPYVYSLNGSPYGSLDQFQNLTDGEYNIELQDAAGCTWDTVIVVDQPAQVTLDLGLDLELQLGDSTELQASFNIPQSRIDTLIWSPIDALNCNDPLCYEPTTDIVENTVFEATLIDIDGCFATASLRVDVLKDRLIYIPSAFSPNDDQNNELFMIHGGIGVYQVNEFRVYNRWGEQVFGATGFQPDDPVYGWDGTFRGLPMNPAVFVYYAKIEFDDGHVELYKGDVTLFR